MLQCHQYPVLLQRLPIAFHLQMRSASIIVPRSPGKLRTSQVFIELVISFWELASIKREFDLFDDGNSQNVAGVYFSCIK